MSEALAQAEQRVSVLEGGLWAESLKTLHLKRQVEESKSEASYLAAYAASFEKKSTF